VTKKDGLKKRTHATVFYAQTFSGDEFVDTNMVDPASQPSQANPT